MSFEKTGNLLAASFKKYGLSDQVSGALVCEKARKIFLEKYPIMVEYWQPKKFTDKILSVAVENASAKSKLFLETQKILEIFQNDKVLKNVKQIKIIRLIEKKEEF